MKTTLIILLSIILAACTSATPSTPRLVDVFSTGSTRPWLEALYGCAGEAGVVLNLSPVEPQIQLRLGEEQGWTGPVYQVGSEEIVIAANLQSPLGVLTIAQANEIFSGKGNQAIQVWAYASAEDIQIVFNELVIGRGGVSSYARLAVSPEHMLQALKTDVNAVGFLPRSWLDGELKELLVAGSVPVLLQTSSEPEGIVRELVACMQDSEGK